MLKKAAWTKEISEKLPKLMIFFLLIFSSFSVFAIGGDSPVGDVFQYVIDSFTGGTGVAIATVALIAVGIAAKLGYAKWTHILQVLAGIGIVFGAPLLVSTLVSYIHA